ncbi:MAG TPA: SDR family oxidoreductase [Acidimicrobiales bacterium]|jgi:NAD(P)-dependent dehydrogenase (short-subunit alcohol dehydrogenase family)|nr:SDR family oxidoreductase [Acidimicrobiales bacterium]
MASLTDRVAVVTGAAQGIGAVYAQALAAEGAAVVVADIRAEGAADTVAAIEAAGGKAVALSVDVSDRASTLALAEEVRSRFGTAHILINNAAIYHSMRTDPQMTVDIDYWRKVFSVNVDGALLMTQAVGPLLIEAGWGRVIMQTSTAPYLGTAGHYGVTKLALVGLTRGFAKELGPHNITVNAIAPGPIFTDATLSIINEDRLDYLMGQQALPMRATPQELVGTLLHLCSDGAAWVTAQTLFVDGGGTPRI